MNESTLRKVLPMALFLHTFVATAPSLVAQELVEEPVVESPAAIPDAPADLPLDPEPDLSLEPVVDRPVEIAFETPMDTVTEVPQIFEDPATVAPEGQIGGVELVEELFRDVGPLGMPPADGEPAPEAGGIPVALASLQGDEPADLTPGLDDETLPISADTEDVEQVVDSRKPAAPASSDQLKTLKEFGDKTYADIDCSNTFGTMVHPGPALWHALISQRSGPRDTLIQASRVYDLDLLRAGENPWRATIGHDEVMSAAKVVEDEKFGLFGSKSMGNCAEMAAVLYSRMAKDESFEGWKIQHMRGEPGWTDGHSWVEATDPSGQRYFMDPWANRTQPIPVKRDGGTLTDMKGKPLGSRYKGNSAGTPPYTVPGPGKNDLRPGRSV